MMAYGSRSGASILGNALERREDADGAGWEYADAFKISKHRADKVYSTADSKDRGRKDSPYFGLRICCSAKVFGKWISERCIGR